MDTTTAATQAGVTVDTIRTWCRMGAVKATKHAGRWVITPASLTYRISLGIRRTTKETSMNLNATYTYTPVGRSNPVTITPKIRTRTTADGEQLTTIKHLIPLLADRIDAITDEGDRLHTLEVLSGAQITLCPTPRDIDGGMITTRDSGRIATTYAGTRYISVNDVLDLAEAIRTHLNAPGEDEEVAENTHTCGHEGQTRYRGRHKNRPVHPDLTRKCPTCRSADRALATDALRATLADLRATLPQITDGSPKQIAWANELRDDVFADPDRPGAEEYAFLGPVTITGQPDGTVTYTHDDQLIELEQDIPAGEITAAQAREILTPMLTTTSASWWINNR